MGQDPSRRRRRHP
ncbi:hypothetical protein LINGRAPRIM_LOCUS1894 [Linum grandiflorum]